MVRRRSEGPGTCGTATSRTSDQHRQQCRRRQHRCSMGQLQCAGSSAQYAKIGPGVLPPALIGHGLLSAGTTSLPSLTRHPRPFIRAPRFLSSVSPRSPPRLFVAPPPTRSTRHCTLLGLVLAPARLPPPAAPCTSYSSHDRAPPIIPFLLRPSLPLPSLSIPSPPPYLAARANARPRSRSRASGTTPTPRTGFWVTSRPELLGCSWASISLLTTLLVSQDGMGRVWAVAQGEVKCGRGGEARLDVSRGRQMRRVERRMEVWRLEQWRYGVWRKEVIKGRRGGRLEELRDGERGLVGLMRAG